jgi:hypothetical protein
VLAFETKAPMTAPQKASTINAKRIFFMARGVSIFELTKGPPWLLHFDENKKDRLMAGSA